MLTMNVRSVVDMVVEHELIRKGRQNEALCFCLDLRLSHWVGNKEYKKEYQANRWLHLLYYCPPEMTYVTVFSSLSDRFGFPNILKEAKWEHQITHDSCWRDLQIFSTVYFDMAKQINAEIGPGAVVAPEAMYQHNSFGLGGLCNWVKVKISRDPADPNHYRRLVQLGE